jgi:hypothetical protein
MKMVTIVSPWRYDAATAQAIRPDNQRRTAILRYASWAAVFPISRVARSPFDCGHFDQSRERRTQQWKDVPRGTMDEVSSHVRLNLPFKLTARPPERFSGW